ncbi:MAG: DUF1918 domain-containing protein [Nonomuraea sp.]|nr:DUF1918 domain-containing protein [Nonomuraea sp.]
MKLQCDRFKVGDRVQSTFDTGPGENPRFEGVVVEASAFQDGAPFYRVRTEGGPHDGFVYVGWDDTLEGSA